jgi:UDP:flavonoid glycosyltransferase YjiC (YdhE family)
MARVLLAWEFGGDLGHVRRLTAVAAALHAQGHEAALAPSDLRTLGHCAAGPQGASRGAKTELFQAPLLSAPPTPDPSPLSASDILLNLGYGDGAGLAGALRAWLALFDLWNPDVVAADYGPTALLAARMRGIPRVTLGSGFAMPPASDPLPALRDWIETAPATLAAIDERLLGAVARAFERLRATQGPPRAAHEIFAADLQLLCTFPEIDPLGPRESAVYVGPVSRGSADEAIGWSAHAGPRIFAYLKPHDARFASLLEALATVAGEAIVAAPGLAPGEAARLTGGTLRVFANTLNLECAMEGADLCVCPAGAGAAAAALAAGVPLALLPEHLEQFLVARRLAHAGVAELVAPDAEPPVDFAAWLRGIVSRDDLREGARHFAAAYRGHSYEGAAMEAARRIAALAAR